MPAIAEWHRVIFFMGTGGMELLERGQDLAELARWLRSAADGQGCIALIAGEAGIGKTALLHELVRQQSKARLLWGACDGLFTPRPLGPLHDIARQAQGALLLALKSGAARDVIFSAALDELEREKHTLVVFEDLHWADEATLDLLKYLGRRIQRTHAMLAVTYRDDEVGSRHPLRYVIGDLPHASVRRILLAPLSESAVTQLARQADRSAHGLHKITGGNPLFVTEVLAASADTVPLNVRDAVLARAARLPAGARDIAELVCVVPGQAETWLLEQAGRLDDAAVEGCLSIGMVYRADGALAYRHELARLAIQDSLSKARQRTLHERVLAVLSTRTDVSPARLAYHADGAHNATEILRYAPVAALHAAALGAHREAASHYQNALNYADALAPEARARLQEQLAYEYYLTSQHERALEVQRAALATWRAAGERLKEGIALRWLSKLSWFAGRREAADRYAADAVATLQPLPPSPALAMAYANRAQLDMEAHETDSAILWAQRTIGLVEPWGNHEILSDALNTLGTVRLIIGDAAGWFDLERSLALALSGGFQGPIARAYTGLCAMAVSRRDYPSAGRYLKEGLEYCERYELDSWWLYLLAYSARLKFEQGDWSGASEDAAGVLRHSRTTPVTRIPALRILGHLRIRRGDPGAIELLEEARVLGGAAPELQRVGTLAAAQAEAAWLAQDQAAVVRAVSAVYEVVRNRRDPRMKGELAVWLWRVHALEQIPADIPAAYSLEMAGDWASAAHAWEKLGCPYERALVLGWHGAEPEQLEALSIFDRLGAAPAAQLLRRLMRERGVRTVPRGSRPSTRHNSLGLTRREAEILSLLSQGLRNAAIARLLFVSTKTIDHHVSSILTKLGVPSRAEAIARMRNANDRAHS